MCGVTVGTLLTTVAMQVVENKVCDQQYASRYCHGNRRITQNDMLCAGSEGQGSCYVSPVMSPPPHSAFADHRLCSAPLSFLRATLMALWSTV